MRNGLRVGMAMALAMAAMGSMSFAKDTKHEEPVAWGMQSGNTGCVIFRESEEMTSEMTSNGGFSTQTIKQLEVVDAIKATLPKKKYSETKEGVDELNQLGMQSHLKFVKIPKKYTPEQLEKAKTMCGVQ